MSPLLLISAIVVGAVCSVLGSSLAAITAIEKTANIPNSVSILNVIYEGIVKYLSRFKRLTRKIIFLLLDLVTTKLDNLIWESSSIPPSQWGFLVAHIPQENTLKLHEFMTLHQQFQPVDHQRLGQRFYNLFLRSHGMKQTLKNPPLGQSEAKPSEVWHPSRSHTWPELFYETDDARALQMINEWLEANNYFNGDLPQELK